MNNPYEELAGMMKSTEAVGAGLQLATMVSGTSCRIGNLTLLPEDLYIPDRLMAKSCTAVAGTCHDDAALTDKSSYSAALTSGDIVVLCALSNQKYVILERVVAAG